MIEFREATPDLVRVFWDGPPPFTFRGHVALVDGEVLGVAGIADVDGLPLAFSMHKDGLSRRDIVRCFRFMQEQFGKMTQVVFAECGGSKRLLERLGFRETGDSTARGRPIMMRLPHG